MWELFQIVWSSYKPLSPEKGMWFINTHYPGTNKQFVSIRELNDIPSNAERYFHDNGYPVQLFIIDGDEQTVATQMNIGWWDEGEHTDEFRDVTLKDLNIIFSENDGFVQLLVDDESGDVIFEENKVIMRQPHHEEEEYEEEYEEEEIEAPICSNCNGTGEGQYDGSTCKVCGGEGIDQVWKQNYKDKYLDYD